MHWLQPSARRPTRHAGCLWRPVILALVVVIPLTLLNMLSICRPV